VFQEVNCLHYVMLINFINNECHICVMSYSNYMSRCTILICTSCCDITEEGIIYLTITPHLFSANGVGRNPDFCACGTVGKLHGQFIVT
jgi:hypothetical protein